MLLTVVLITTLHAYLICHESYFEYNGVFYKQHQGVPIGSSMAGILVELVVREVEVQISQSLSSEFLFYSMYVDDLFVAWRNSHNTGDLVQHFSKEEFGLKLNLAQVSRSEVNFLDIKIFAGIDTFNTTIYIKSTAPPVIIPRWSFDP